MEILLRGINTKLVTRLPPSSHLYLSSSSSSSSSSSRVLSSNFSTTTTLLAPSPSSAEDSPFLKRNQNVTNPNSSVVSVLDRVTRVGNLPPSYSFEEEETTLWERIKSVTDTKASVKPMLDEWIKEGNTAEKPLLRSLISLLQQEKRYSHALEISNELACKDCRVPPYIDPAIRARLFQRTCGLEHVEAYFNDDCRKTYSDYVTLLCYYLEENYVEKAEAIMQEMIEKGIFQMQRSSFPFNLLMNLYSRTQELEKMNILIQEMERNQITADKYTMGACIEASHISGIEKILDQKNDRKNYKERWIVHSMAANMYLKFGLIEPALTVLRKMENILTFLGWSRPFEFLLSLYVKTGRKDEVYRVWNTCKHSLDLDHNTFHFMMSYVLKLGDIKVAEMIAEDWDSQCIKNLENFNLNFQHILDNLNKNGSESDSQCTEHSGLWKRIKTVTDTNDSVVPVLNQWICECEWNSVTEPLLWSFIELLHGYRRYKHATEISQWMRDCQYATLSPSQSAIRLRVIYRTRGLKHAETYFRKPPRPFLTYHDYYALLCCYVEENSVKKAEDIMEEMRAKGMEKSPYPYNLLTRLYTQNGDFDKINILVQEMERNGICPDRYTMSYLMAAYVASSNISGMEKILNQIDKDPQLVEGRRTYSIAANGYLKFGLIEQALTVLRKMEKMMPLGRSTKDFACLLSLYAKTDKKDDLVRVWDAYKSLIELNDEIFSSMLSHLLKLEDMEGAERIFGEWESQCTKYNSQLLNKLLIAYCKKGLLKKAEGAVAKALKWKTISATTITILAGGYVDQNQMTEAVETFKRAVFVCSKEWMPYPYVLNACLDYLEAQGDTRAMEEIIKSFKSKGLLTRDMYLRLVRTCVATGKVECLDHSLMDDFPGDEEINKILEANKSSA